MSDKKEYNISLLEDFWFPFVKCTRINCLFNTYDSMECTHDMHMISPNGECKYYTRTFTIPNKNMTSEETKEYINSLIKKYRSKQI